MLDREEKASILRVARRNRAANRQRRVPVMDLTQGPMAATPREREVNPEALAAYDRADDADFSSLVQGIHDDPSGRGATPALPEEPSAPSELAEYGGVAKPTSAPTPQAPNLMTAYGKVAPPKRRPVDAGPPPESELDSALHGVPGMLGTGLALLGGNRNQAAEYGDETAQRAEGKRQERIAFGRRKADLEREAEDQGIRDQQYAEERNFERDRAGRSDTREDRRDNMLAEDRAFGRSIDAETQGWRREDRDPARIQAGRDAEFQDWKARADYEAQLRARAARARGAGRGDLDARRLSAYEQGVEVLQAQGLQGQELEAAKLRLKQAVMTSNPEQSSLALTGETGRVEQTQARDMAKIQAKAAESAQARDRLREGLLRQKELLEAKLARGQRYLAGKEPAVEKAKEYLVGGRGAAMVFGDTTRGSSGFTAEDDEITNNAQLVGRAEYYDRTNNSANLKSEAEVADRQFFSNGTVQGALAAVNRALGKVQDSEKAGVVRIDDGTVVPYTPTQEDTQAPGAAGIEWDQ